jgi:hypothetical protein
MIVDDASALLEASFGRLQRDPMLVMPQSEERTKKRYGYA